MNDAAPNPHAPPGAHGSRRARGPVSRGLIAGIVAATAVAIWFLVIDGISGQPFRTPAFLARVVLGIDDLAMTAGPLALYTLLHYAAFMAVGVALAGLVEQLGMVPEILLGLVIGFLLFDLLFYGGIWLTGVNVVDYLGWPAALVGNAIAGVALVSTLYMLGPGHHASWGEILREHQVVREGLVVGLIGAVAVMAWFLAVDLVAGRLLFTPAALGSVLFQGATSVAEVQVDAVTILAYTGLHLAAFLLTGLIAAGVVGFAEDLHAYVLLGAVLLFVTFETFFIGLLTIVAQWLLEIIPWWSIALANLLAAAVMGAFLYRRHPKLVAALNDQELEQNVERSERPVPPATPSV